MKKITVLGAGMVGGVIATDLSKDYEVTLVDLNSECLNSIRGKANLETQVADLSNSEEIRNVVKDADLVIGAVPGFMGFEMLKAVIEAGKNIADISFSEQNPMELNELAKTNGVTAIVDCGVAPGMSNFILGYHNERMEVDSFVCYVGGLPVKRTLPFEYKAPFSPIDVIEEYTRPARFVENGKIVTKEALTDSELLEFDEIGTLEAFNTDGLRTLLETIKVPNMKEKTLRYPNHIEKIKMLKEMGFFSTDSLTLKNGVKLKPLDFTSELILPQWKLQPEEEEFTVMKIQVSGLENGNSKTYTYDLLDRFDKKTKTSSMARTTGFTCSASANLILKKLFTEKGVFPPELVGKNQKCFENVLSYLKNRNVNYILS
ncbi:MAG: saccharopine dehydrogenase [Calditrichaeota bacterium]|nr:MAG: saccharopine dehydrogenase [Calditrichota bacterium]